MLNRLLHLIIKELQSLLGTHQGRMLLIMPVILQITFFPFAATLEVRNSTLAIYNQDNGPLSNELIHRLSQMAAFSKLIMVRNEDELQRTIDHQDALLAIRFQPDFSRRLLSRQSAPLQIILDGRRSNSAQIAGAYINQVINSYAIEINRPSSEPPPHFATIKIRHIFNPNLEFKWHVLPSLIALITTIGCLTVTALSVAREREAGTFEQLLVSPLTPAYILAGKAIPGILVALLQGSIIAAASVWVYRVPMTGSLGLLLFSMVCYGAALAGIGLFISSLSSTQQQAFLGIFLFMSPAVMLSGYIAPIENMPVLFQWIAMLNPLAYLIQIAKGIFLKDFGFLDAWPYLWPLLLIALGTLSIALAMFRRHIA